MKMGSDQARVGSGVRSVGFLHFHAHVHNHPVVTLRGVADRLYHAGVEKCPLRGTSITLLCGYHARRVEMIDEIGGQLFELTLGAALSTDIVGEHGARRAEFDGVIDKGTGTSQLEVVRGTVTLGKLSILTLSAVTQVKGTGRKPQRLGVDEGRLSHTDQRIA